MDFNKLSFNLKHIVFTAVATSSVVTGYWMNDFRIERMEIKHLRDITESERIDELNRIFLEKEIGDVNTKMRAKWIVHQDFFKNQLNKVQDDQENQWSEINKKQYK